MTDLLKDIISDEDHFFAYHLTQQSEENVSSFLQQPL
jgi:hypothetical protein